jgi:hypothetical protein
MICFFAQQQGLFIVPDAKSDPRFCDTNHQIHASERIPDETRRNYRRHRPGINNRIEKILPNKKGQHNLLFLNYFEALLGYMRLLHRDMRFGFWYSNAPASQSATPSSLPSTGRGKPRWSSSKHNPLGTRSMAGLVFWSACVAVGPPLNASGFNCAAATILPLPRKNPHD